MQNGMLPEYFSKDMVNRITQNSNHEHFTRQTEDLRLPAVRHEFARNGISYKYPSTLNNMPANFKEKIQTHSLNGFKFYFKRVTVDAYGGECDVPDCYVCQRT